MPNAISVLSMSLPAQKTLELPFTVWHANEFRLYAYRGYISYNCYSVSGSVLSISRRKIR